MSLFGILLLVFIALVFVAALLFAPKGWRTRLFNWISGGATALLGVIQIAIPALSGVDFSGFLSTKEAALAVALIAIGNAILREVTTSPAGKAL
jgi:uncharacterized protein YggT (Ycf19 family)